MAKRGKPHYIEERNKLDNATSYSKACGDQPWSGINRNPICFAIVFSISFSFQDKFLIRWCIIPSSIKFVGHFLVCAV